MHSVPADYHGDAIRGPGGVPLFCLFVAVFEAFAFCICQLRSYPMQLGWRIRWLNPLSITSIIMAFFGHCVPSEGHATSRDGFSRVSNMPRSHMPSHFSSRNSLAQGNIIHTQVEDYGMPGPNSRRPCRHAVCLEPKRSGFAPLRPLTPDAEPFAAAKMRHSAMLLRNFGSPVGVGWSRCLHGRQVTAHRGVIRLSPDKTMLYGVLSITFKGGIQIPRPTFFCSSASPPRSGHVPCRVGVGGDGKTGACEIIQSLIRARRCQILGSKATVVE